MTLWIVFFFQFLRSIIVDMFSFLYVINPSIFHAVGSTYIMLASCPFTGVHRWGVRWRHEGFLMATPRCVNVETIEIGECSKPYGHPVSLQRFCKPKEVRVFFSYYYYFFVLTRHRSFPQCGTGWALPQRCKISGTLHVPVCHESGFLRY